MTSINLNKMDGRMTACLICALLLFQCTTPRHHFGVQRGLISSNAMVVSAHPLASNVGAEIMKKGGNAWDAAIGVQFALAVVYPVAGNIGGGGFAVYRTEEGQIGALDFREKAPKASHRDMYLTDEGEVIDRLSLEGHLAAGVPGTVDGMVRLHNRFGKLPWGDLVQPAIDLARGGFSLTERGASSLNRAQSLFVKHNTYDMELIKEEPWEQGNVLRQFALAETLERIRDRGRSGFYSGKTAQYLLEEMQRGGGIISQDDLDDYESSWRKPVIGQYRGHRIISMPPPSSGGIAVVQMLEGLESFPVEKYGHNHWKSVHLMTEIEKRAYADRATYLGDPDYFEVPQKMLLDTGYLSRRMAGISLKRTTPAHEIKEGHVEVVESVETTHFSIVDADGNAVSLTTTLNSYFGCKVMVKNAGFFLNNEMDDFSVKAGVPNQFGLVGNEANEIVPEKRMLSSMTPTIVDKDDRLVMVVGTPGGSTIITSVFQTIVNVIDHEMTMQEAVDAKRFHHQWLPDRILTEENTFDERTKRRLIRKGHDFEIRSGIGLVDAILILPNGDLEGGADRRGDDQASGF